MTVMEKILFNQFKYFKKYFQERDKKLFPNLPAWDTKDIPLSAHKLFQIIKNQMPRYSRDLFTAEDNKGNAENLPAGYTYWGQFIAHELTYTTNIFEYHQKQKNFTSQSRIIPRLNLSTIYGNGPELQPELYDQKEYYGRTYFKIDKPQVKDRQNKNRCQSDLNRQLYRDSTIAVALIPDSRNDDNLIISQFHVAMQTAHNRLVEILINQHPDSKDLKSHRQNARKPRHNKHAIPKHGARLKTNESIRELVNSYKRQKEESARKIDAQVNLLADISETLNRTRSTNPTATESIDFTKPNEKIDSSNLEDFLDYYMELRKNFNPGIISANESLNESTLHRGTSRSLSSRERIYQENLCRFDQMAIWETHKLDTSINRIRSKIIITLDSIFEKAKQQIQWHFQWLILNDFLPKIIGKEHFDFIYDKRAGKLPKINYQCFLWKKSPYLPIEFSTAFFRFGHSMVRQTYRFNCLNENKAIFAVKNNNEIKDTLFDWRLFFPDPNAPDPKLKPNFSDSIDTFITSQMLGSAGVTNGNSKNILFRNLVRSKNRQLPSGQDIAKYLLKQKIIAASTLENFPSEERQHKKQQIIDDLVKKFPDLEEKDFDFPTQKKEREAIKKKVINSLCHHSPIWLYTLMEAQICADGKHLGPVAGRVIAEVLVGIIEGDQTSFLNAEKPWKPHLKIEAQTKASDNQPPTEYSMIDFLKYAKVYEPPSELDCSH